MLLPGRIQIGINFFGDAREIKFLIETFFVGAIYLLQNFNFVLKIGVFLLQKLCLFLEIFKLFLSLLQIVFILWNFFLGAF